MWKLWRRWNMKTLWAVIMYICCNCHQPTPLLSFPRTASLSRSSSHSFFFWGFSLFSLPLSRFWLIFLKVLILASDLSILVTLPEYWPLIRLYYIILASYWLIIWPSYVFREFCMTGASGRSRPQPRLTFQRLSDQSEASIQVTWPVLTNQRPVFITDGLVLDISDQLW